MCGIVIAAFFAVPFTFMNIERGLIVWSAYDYTLTKSISGILTSRHGIFEIFDYLNSEEYNGLSYPYQHEDIIYYTTQNLIAGKDSIISRTAEETHFILSHQGDITYKKIYDSQLYYIINKQIRKFDMHTEHDMEVINDVNPDFGFDINSAGEILYTSALSEELMLLRPTDSQASRICDGRAAKFIDDDNIVFAFSDKIYRFNLIDQNRKVVKNRVNCTYILLNPLKTHIIFTHMRPTVDAPDMYAFEELYIMSVNGRNCRQINGFRSHIPNTATYGIEWIDL